jgi:hypothetical protein
MNDFEFGPNRKFNNPEELLYLPPDIAKQEVAKPAELPIVAQMNRGETGYINVSGIWRDTVSGRLLIDGSTHVYSFDDAIRLIDPETPFAALAITEYGYTIDVSHYEDHFKQLNEYVPGESLEERLRKSRNFIPMLLHGIITNPHNRTSDELGLTDEQSRILSDQYEVLMEKRVWVRSRNLEP